MTQDCGATFGLKGQRSRCFHTGTEGFINKCLLAWNKVNLVSNTVKGDVGMQLWDPDAS